MYWALLMFCFQNKVQTLSLSLCLYKVILLLILFILENIPLTFLNVITSQCSLCLSGLRPSKQDYQCARTLAPHCCDTCWHGWGDTRERFSLSRTATRRDNVLVTSRGIARSTSQSLSWHFAVILWIVGFWNGDEPFSFLMRSVQTWAPFCVNYLVIFYIARL